jgi:hypothetical protein
LEKAYGGMLEFEELPNRKSTRIAEYLPGAEIDTRAAWDDYETWAIDRIGRLRDAIAAVGGIPPLETPTAVDPLDPTITPTDES